MLVIEVRDGELLAAIEQAARDHGIDSAAIVTLIGAVDSFTLSTMPAGDPTKDVITDYELPAEMTATGEIVDGRPHIHAVMAVEGDRAISGHLHKAQIGTWFARAYLLADSAEPPTPDRAPGQLAEGFADVVAVIRSQPGGRQAFQAATDLVALLRTATKDAGQLRAALAARLGSAAPGNLGGLSRMLDSSQSKRPVGRADSTCGDPRDRRRPPS